MKAIMTVMVTRTLITTVMIVMTVTRRGRRQRKTATTISRRQTVTRMTAGG